MAFNVLMPVVSSSLDWDTQESGLSNSSGFAWSSDMGHGSVHHHHALPISIAVSDTRWIPGPPSGLLFLLYLARPPWFPLFMRPFPGCVVHPPGLPSSR
jgi:hypothetical protein